MVCMCCPSCWISFCVRLNKPILKWPLAGSSWCPRKPVWTMLLTSAPLCVVKSISNLPPAWPLLDWLPHGVCLLPVLALSLDMVFGSIVHPSACCTNQRALCGWYLVCSTWPFQHSIPCTSTLSCSSLFKTGLACLPKVRPFFGGLYSIRTCALRFLMLFGGAAQAGHTTRWTS